MRDVQVRLQPYLSLLHRRDAADTGSKCIQGLLSHLPRKSAEPISELFNSERKVFQRFVGQAPWSGTKVRLHMQTEIGREIGEEDGVISVDPTNFAKKGDKSIGVARQWSGRQGKVDNCQVGVFASYASRKGSALLDGQLYIPKDWIDDIRAIFTLLSRILMKLSALTFWYNMLPVGNDHQRSMI